ncbi:uncharacterized protein LOC128351874 isoform X1 [Hemicordylus capensis]|uniref:uncharacterized protein LOC128351874 isoform X1 n=1 Tax=Hemicordylus capensis TaxID=884348 RepID=UPI0023027C8A|nr:uncharacterized protein LOC128351874 isoform X1 [Hemicordylus capensis]
MLLTNHPFMENEISYTGWRLIALTKASVWDQRSQPSLTPTATTSNGTFSAPDLQLMLPAVNHSPGSMGCGIALINTFYSGDNKIAFILFADLLEWTSGSVPVRMEPGWVGFGSITNPRTPGPNRRTVDRFCTSLQESASHPLTGADDERTCVRRPISSSSHLVAQKLLLSPLLPAHGAASEGTTLFFGGPAEPSKKRVKHPKTPKRQSRAEGSSEGKPPQEGRPPALLGKIPKAGLHLANAPGRGVTSGVKAFPTWKRGETPGGRWRQRWTLPEDRNPSPGAT